MTVAFVVLVFLVKTINASKVVVRRRSVRGFASAMRSVCLAVQTIPVKQALASWVAHKTVQVLVW